MYLAVKKRREVFVNIYVCICIRRGIEAGSSPSAVGDRNSEDEIVQRSKFCERLANKKFRVTANRT